MPSRKTAAQRIASLDAYSSAVPPNPLVAMREEMEGDLSQKEFALILGVNKGVVTSAEDGMFPLIPACYRARIKNILQMNTLYQEHRREKRMFFFEPDMFPDNPAKRKPMLALLQWFDLTPYRFGTRACVSHPDIWKMCTTKRQMTSSLEEFFLQVGLDRKWIDEFNVGLSYNAISPVKLPGAATNKIASTSKD